MRLQNPAVRSWLAPAGLILLSAMPIAAGIVRLLAVSGAPSVVIHIVASVLFCVLGAFQFHQRLRIKHLFWHRNAGRILIACSLASALSGLWLTQFHAAQHGALHAFRIFIGCFMICATLLSVKAVLRKNIVAHRAWILRAYAVAQGAGTQALILLPAALLTTLDASLNALLMIAAWLINLAVAVYLIRSFYRG